MTTTAHAIPHDWRSRQPGKTLWSLIALCDILTRSLLLSFLYIPRSQRQNPHWTWRQALITNIFRVSFQHVTYTKFLLPFSLDPGAEQERFITMELQTNTTGTDDPIYKGPFHSETVLPAKVGGTWYPNLPTSDELLDGPVILHFHGGSFLWGTGRQGDCGFTGDTLAALLGACTHALLVQYRLAADPAAPFPAAIQDALTSYAYLLAIKVPTTRIVISGDSAGAILALALLRYLASDAAALPAPGACLLFSPSVDLVVQGDANAIDAHRSWRTDLLPGCTLAWGVEAFLGESRSRDEPYLAPARYPFATETPVWLQGGSAEVLIDTYHAFVSGMQAVEGNRVEFYEVPNAPHDILFVGHILGWRAQVEEVAGAAGKFLRSVGISAESKKDV